MSHGDKEQLYPGGDGSGKGLRQFDGRKDCCVRYCCLAFSRDKKTQRRLCLVRMIVGGTLLSIVTLVVPAIDAYFITSSPLPFALSPGDTYSHSDSLQSSVSGSYTKQRVLVDIQLIHVLSEEHTCVERK